MNFATRKRDSKKASTVLMVVAMTIALYQSACSGAASGDAVPAVQGTPGSQGTPGGQFSASTSTLNLGNVAVGDSKTSAVTFMNSTNSKVTILSVSVSGLQRERYPKWYDHECGRNCHS